MTGRWHVLRVTSMPGTRDFQRPLVYEGRYQGHKAWYWRWFGGRWLVHVKEAE